MPTDARTPLVMIHGAWLTAESWETFADFFSARGYDVTAPEWPRKQMGAAAQREPVSYTHLTLPTTERV